MWSDGAVVVVKKSGNPDMARAIEGAIVKIPEKNEELVYNKIERLESDQFIKGQLLYGNVGKRGNPVRRFIEAGWACVYCLLFCGR